MTRKKLIEVALPLDAINAESAREKSIRHGHPSTLHLWWARRPLAACRAVIFSQLVDDPDQPDLPPAYVQALDALPEPDKKELDWDNLSPGEQRRYKLFAFIEKLVKWENINDDQIIGTARKLIRAATGDAPPPLLDPFAGGGSIPLEAQRLGLEAHASDLNPVAVLINKALIEIPPKFAGQPPVHPDQEQRLIKKAWRGAEGLAEDVRYYGQWMRDEAERRIGHLYPRVSGRRLTQMDADHDKKISKNQRASASQDLTVIAWLWARTVPSPNPAANGAHVPLVRSFALSTKKGKETWVEPVIDRNTMTYHFEIRSGKGQPPEGTVNRKGGTCLLTGAPMPFDHIRKQGRAGNMHARLMAIVAEGPGGRIYLPPDEEHVRIAESAQPEWRPDAALPHNPRDFKTPNYGMTMFADLFTSRQLTALTTFSDLVMEVRTRIEQDARAAGLDHTTAYADAVATYLGEAVSKLATFHNTLAYWRSKEGKSATGFGRQALAMTWDYTEVNPFAGAGGDFFEIVSKAAPRVLFSALSIGGVGKVKQADATKVDYAVPLVVSTDPPYYDNISYADLSDFFYVWLRRSLNKISPDLFSTLLVPKKEELVATPYRFDSDKERAKQFFEAGLRQVFVRMRYITHFDYPLTIYYAFKQTEIARDGDEGTENDMLAPASTGWETMLESLIQACFTITGTWPIRTEQSKALKDTANVLASSIVLVCRPRPEDAPLATRRDFLKALRQELPAALKKLQKGNIAPVDLAQASIGPGMAIFSRHGRVLESDGSAMRVRTALALINQALDEYLAEQEGEFDADTRWALAWYEQFAFKEGAFGDAETLSKAKNTSIAGMVEAGLLKSGGGKVRLLKRSELKPDWDPAEDPRLTVWEVVQHLIRALDKKGETGAAALLARVPAGPAEAARDLAYRLYTLCERKGWAAEALPYNSLVVAWPEVARLAREVRQSQPVQGRLM